MSATLDHWLPLRDYELPRAWVAPALSLCRSFNTLFDKAFYDVEAFEHATSTPDVGLESRSNMPVAGMAGVDLSADTNPEGSLLVIDAAEPPFVQQFRTLGAFRGSAAGAIGAVRIASITGVGSSALGSAALAWDVSRAFGEPVLAIVPGYGVADALLQGLGGWFGYGVHDALETKPNLQRALAMAAPAVAKIGRRLSAPVDDACDDAPVFRFGSGSADVLHDLLEERRFVCVVGHSKGALTIGNALGSLDETLISDLQVITLGCPIETRGAGVRYAQYLGLFDTLGWLNSWNHQPTHWVETVHSTNMMLPLSMDVVDLCARSAPLPLCTAKARQH